ncbi:MAG: hypothetical protein ACLS6W_10195 [Ruminococcus sp.]
MKPQLHVQWSGTAAAMIRRKFYRYSMGWWMSICGLEVCRQRNAGQYSGIPDYCTVTSRQFRRWYGRWERPF